jgi:Flp pilus assembly protein TadG
MRGKNRKCTSGQALLEITLIVPVLFLLVVNVVNFGGLYYACNTVIHASRSAAQYAVTGPAYLGYGSANGLAISPPSSTDTSVATSDLNSLPVTLAPTITVCDSNSASSTCTVTLQDNSKPTFIDPEVTSQVTTVYVRYRYCPFIPGWNSPALGIYTTLSACSPDKTTGGVMIQRIAVMRMIQ